jgi:hypothetical protein
MKESSTLTILQTNFNKEILYFRKGMIFEYNPKSGIFSRKVLTPLLFCDNFESKNIAEKISN